MPISLCTNDDEANPENKSPEWREPPGRLGEYVRRVKRLQGSIANMQEGQKTS